MRLISLGLAFGLSACGAALAAPLPSHKAQLDSKVVAIEVVRECPSSQVVAEIQADAIRWYKIDATTFLPVQEQSRCPADEYGPKYGLVWIEVDGKPVLLPTGRKVTIQLWGGVTVGVHSRVQE